jgi:hypothetical protein
MLSVIMLSIFIPSVIMMIVVLPSVAAPTLSHGKTFQPILTFVSLALEYHTT